MTYQLIASPYPEGHVVVRPGHDGAVRIGTARYAELRDAPPDAPVPDWLTGPVRAGWGTDLTGHPIRDTVLVRPETTYGYARASYELNLGCNYDCEHCYLGEKMFAGMDWSGRERLLNVMADAGVLWLQLTGGEPLIDPLFAETHAAAWDMGMMIMISSNGSRLDQPRMLDLLTKRRPYQLALSLYGATEESYDAMTRRRGSFRRFMRGLAAAYEAGLPMRINIVVSNRNAHEIPQMRAIADRYDIPSFEYTDISPTIHGGGEVLPSQAREVLRTRKPYTGCNAGITHFHADPHGRASICKVGRDPQVDLIAEGAPGLRRLAAVADALVTRHGGCSGCTLQKTCASGWGAWTDSGMQGGPVDELLDVAVERPALDQLEVEVGRTLEDRVQPGLPGDHREERHLDAVDQAGAHQRPVHRQAAVRAQRYLGPLLEPGDDVDGVAAHDVGIRPVEGSFQCGRHHRGRQAPHPADPRVTHLGLLGARGQHPRKRPVRVGPEDHPLLLAIEGEAVLEELGALLAPVASPVAAGGAEAVEAGKDVECVGSGHDALLEC